MCYICKCFSWALDFVQRVLTFALSCIMFFAILLGCCTAIAAGIAYGYNFMLAEYLNIARTDLSVYVRRGQFNEKPNMEKGFRRRGDVNDFFSSNASDYQDTREQVDSMPLSDTWQKAVDTRKYAEKLTKYSRGQGKGKLEVKPLPLLPDFRTGTAADKDTIVRRVFPNVDQITLPVRTLPVKEATRSTQTLKRTSSKIVMRTFKPIESISVPSNMETLEPEFYEDHAGKNRRTLEPKLNHKKNPDIKISLKDSSKIKSVTKTKWTVPMLPPDYGPEDIDEGNTVYRPV